MKRLFKLALGAITFLASSNPGFAQGPPATVLEIDGANTVFYDNDVTDYSKLAANPNTTTPTDANNFLSFIGISDIVAVNGQPAKGA